jgi:hypothetical protein
MKSAQGWQYDLEARDHGGWDDRRDGLSDDLIDVVAVLAAIVIMTLITLAC